MDGILINKGSIKLHKENDLTTTSIINKGSIKCTSKLTCEVKKMFWNSGEIEVEDFIVGANIFHQISIDKIRPSLKARSFYLQVFEKLEPLKGNFHSEKLEITCFGTFLNEVNIKSKTIILLTQDHFINKGCLDADFFEMDSYDDVLNQGEIKVEKEACISMNNKNVFLQKNCFFFTKLTLKGADSSFINNGALVVDELHLFDNIYFENELFKEQSIILRAFTNSYTGEFKNKGNLVVEYGTLFALHNLNCFRSEKLKLSYLKQEGEMFCTDLVIEQNGMNSGKLNVDKLSGNGIFYHSGNIKTKMT